MSASRVLPEVDFDRDGKQTGYLRLFHSVHESAYGFIPIPIVVVRNGEGPTVLLTAGNHGDEYEGQIALANLARWLTPEKIRGRVILLTAMNLPAAAAGRRTSPIDGGNLNRSFPGDPDGTVTQQIAYFAESVLVPMADFVMDFHSGGSSLLYTPCALTSQVEDSALFERQMAALRAFGAPLAYVQRGAQGQGANQTLGGGAMRHGVPSLGTELGGAGTLGRAGLAIAERGIRNLLIHLGILSEEARLAPPEATRILDVIGQDYFVYASQDGLFEPLVEPGDTVEAGQPAGLLHTPETPWLEPAELRFARAGVVLCKRIPGRSRRGDCLFHLGTDRSD